MASVFLAYEYRRTDLNVNMRLTFECDYPEDIISDEKILPKITTTFSGYVQQSAIYQIGNSTFYVIFASKRNQTIRVRWYENGSQTYTETFNLPTSNGQNTLFTKVTNATISGKNYGYSFNDNGTNFTSGQGCSITTNTRNIKFATTLADYKLMYGGDYVTYQWSSVPAISGKNGILLPLSTLNDVNNGEEITTSDTSKFNLNDSSNIKNLVDAVVNDF